MLGLLLTLLVILAIASVCVWAVKKLAPEPFATWAFVLIVVIAVFYAGAVVLGQAPIVHFRGL